jgi:hypothetical protein
LIDVERAFNRTSGRGGESDETTCVGETGPAGGAASSDDDDVCYKPGVEQATAQEGEDQFSCKLALLCGFASLEPSILDLPYRSATARGRAVCDRRDEAAAVATTLVEQEEAL